MDRSDTLVVLPTLPVRVTPTGRVALTEKFVDGMREYLSLWGGPVSAFMEPSDAPTSNLDEREYEPSDLPFQLQVVSFLDPGLGPLLAGHRLAHCAVSYRQNHLGGLCRAIGVPCVYTSEYSLQTRWQVIRASRVNPLITLRRGWWEYRQEVAQRRAIRLAAGVQCNGTPTFEAYKAISPSPLLYFDTRVSEDMLVAEAELAARTEHLRCGGGPLRLLFSGRLIAMKGADHLIAVADELRTLGTPFKMTICGDGALLPEMKAEIARRNLGELVELAGNLDFKAELLPRTRRGADLFVCCHRTGDPSCSYLEVMSCGVPIVGYDNEAFLGIARESGVGWTSPMGKPRLLAQRIDALNRDRAAVVEASHGAVEFGRRHTFNRTFRARIEHMKACAGPARVGQVVR